MGQDTPNHGYKRPDKGKEDWHQPLNQNFEDIDTDVEVRDSGKPTEGENDYEPTVGGKYLDTYASVVYIGESGNNGPVWSPALTLGRYTPPNSTSSVARAGSVVFGHPSNGIGDDVSGATISGGGRVRYIDDGVPTTPPVVPMFEENEVTENYGTVCGGFDNTASGVNATVGGGGFNTAGGDFSFAAGKRAKVQNDGTFVWADSGSGDVSSTGADQFLVEASGGTGIGTNSPVTTLHVEDSVAENGAGNLGRHVAAIRNTNGGSNPTPDVLGLQLTNQGSQPGEFNSYISFMNSSDTIGNIQGDGNGGVEFVGSLADFAEFFPKANPEQEFADGTVVGLNAGEVVALDAESEPDTVLVVSTASLVTGNRPIDEDKRDAYVKLSLVGQVPVRVSASVGHGDVLVAGPDDDGTAVARTDCKEAARPVVGMALGEGEAGEQVLALVGGPGIDTAPTSGAASRTGGPEPAEDTAGTGARTARVDELAQKEKRIADLEAENEQLRERLAAVEDHLGLGDSKATTRGVADD